jgi:hypothetical protein
VESKELRRTDSAMQWTGGRECAILLYNRIKKMQGGVKKKHDDLSTTRERYQRLCIWEG